MITLTDGMLLYHGSFTEVSNISLKKCTHGKDFGSGFYITSSYTQAENFVASNRRKTLFPTIKTTYNTYDIIGGKIANDRTARTLQLYTSGGYGEPGSKEADDIAIMTLLPNRLEDQFCFCSQKAIQTLEFIRSDSYDITYK